MTEKEIRFYTIGGKEKQKWYDIGHRRSPQDAQNQRIY